AFAGIDTARQTGAWYVGTSPFNALQLSSSLQGFSGDLGSAIAATAGSSGGSGFSGGAGGGGGGGGGGSWGAAAAILVGSRGLLAQPVRALRSHRRGRWFESSTAHRDRFAELPPVRPAQGGR